ncbi:molybdopterin molybdotransferase MoeA [Tunturibacter empetritectus]|uniref:Molybdopterin molybdenumtransferase n=1 Tax=Tunturiibacter empetritectus TaxID=3069691 RepID=A0A7W8MQL2_9BACT|nr:gephyrin-like molybdotransferase Glp [Edaphobacter lichenicola]MBB5316826.1 molybdopterin molybdotransferase [Edaphobacter lichenicola]
MQPAAAVLGFDQALAMVLQHATAVPRPPSESLALLDCGNRVLAKPVLADRDQPPFHRSTRDGFALRASDTPRPLKVVGQVRAGEQWQGSTLEPNAAIEIMTGAPIPEGADAVVMIEHVERDQGSIRLLAGRTIRSGENIVPQGSEARAGQTVLAPGSPIEGAEIALAASCGYSELQVFRKPKVAIVATGDELVDLTATPAPQQIRNSNSYGLAELIRRAGGEPIQLPIAPDRRPELEQTIRAARRCDLMLLSGGVSMGKYDLVEEVLQALGAEFFFTGVRMQPGKPLVLGRLPAESNLPPQFFFGLPGNPVSTQVTFHCFVEPMLRAMAGAGVQQPRFLQATLAEDVAGKAGLMRVLPARWTSDRIRPEVRLVAWQGSGDLAANARANCYAVLPPDKDHFAAGDVITILLR